MPTIKELYPKLNPDDEETRIQASISLRNKRRVVAACGDDGIHQFIIATTYERIADFANRHSILSYGTAADFAKLVNFIRHGTDPRIDREAVDGNDKGRVDSVQHEAATATGKSGGAGPGRAAGSRKQTSKK